MLVYALRSCFCRRVEELQFRLEEEGIDKTTLEAQKMDTEERIFELEEALAMAKETNERIETELEGTDDQPLKIDARVQAAEKRALDLQTKLEELQKQVNVSCSYCTYLSYIIFIYTRVGSM